VLLIAVFFDRIQICLYVVDLSMNQLFGKMDVISANTVECKTQRLTFDNFDVHILKIFCCTSAVLAQLVDTQIV
jgi:hypothetical protein